MPPTMTDSADQSERTGDSLEAARREKLRKIIALGVDPWGSRFDNHRPIGEIRARESEIVATPPEPGQRHGEQTRTAGSRSRTHRADARHGQAHFCQHSRLVRRYPALHRQEAGRRRRIGSWPQCFDLGDFIGVDGELKHTQKGELTIFVDQLHFLGKSLETPPDKYHGLNDPELRQRLRYLDLIHAEGVLPRFLNRTKIVQ